MTNATPKEDLCRQRLRQHSKNGLRGYPDVMLRALPMFVRLACGLALTTILIWLTSATIFVSATTAANTTAPIVDLGYAQYQGYFDAQTNITNFLGIRYAAPPVGEYRIRLPSVVLAILCSCH